MAVPDRVLLQERCKFITVGWLEKALPLRSGADEFVEAQETAEE